MVFNQDCDLISTEEVDNCIYCYRYETCKEYFEKNPDKVYCPSDLK